MTNKDLGGVADSDESAQEMPVALEVTEKVSLGAEFSPTDYFKEEVEEGDELVRRKDAEEAEREMAYKAMSDGYKAGKQTGRELERQRILDKLQDRKSQLKNEISDLEEEHILSDSGMDNKDACMIRKWKSKKIEELEELRDNLQDEECEE